MNNPDHISESLETIFWVKILKFFYADPGSGIEKIRMFISDPQHWFPGLFFQRNSSIGIRIIQEKSAPILVCELCHDGFPNHNLLKLHRRTAHTTPLPARGGAGNRKRKSLLVLKEEKTPGVEQDVVVQTTSSELETGRQGEENTTPGHRSGFITERIE
jgi:hypothetical protein